MSTPGSDDYGTGPDEIYSNVKATFDRVARLILSQSHTKPPESVRLAELRQLAGLSQGEVAGNAGFKQAHISRIEGRNDMLVSTLIKVVTAMGASLSIRARFADGMERELNVCEIAR